MDLLERSSALGELGGLLAATATGGRVVLVAGEAGIGKSALVRQFTEERSADAWFLLGACDPLLTPRALGPLHDIARQTGGRLAELLAAGGPREAVFAAFLDELDQGGRPRVVVVEDAHWADEATLDLLVFLGRRMERTRALLLVTYRDDEVAADHPLRAVDSCHGETGTPEERMRQHHAARNRSILCQAAVMASPRVSQVRVASSCPLSLDHNASTGLSPCA